MVQQARQRRVDALDKQAAPREKRRGRRFDIPQPQLDDLRKCAAKHDAMRLHVLNQACLCSEENFVEPPVAHRYAVQPVCERRSDPSHNLAASGDKPWSRPSDISKQQPFGLLEQLVEREAVRFNVLDRPPGRYCGRFVGYGSDPELHRFEILTDAHRLTG